MTENLTFDQLPKAVTMLANKMMTNSLKVKLKRLLIEKQEQPYRKARTTLNRTGSCTIFKPYST